LYTVAYRYIVATIIRPFEKSCFHLYIGTA
jgi:hypothetical protein